MDFLTVLEFMKEFAASGAGNVLGIAAVVACVLSVPIYALASVVARKIKEQDIAKKKRAIILQRIREERLQEGGSYEG